MDGFGLCCVEANIGGVMFYLHNEAGMLLFVEHRSLSRSFIHVQTVLRNLTYEARRFTHLSYSLCRFYTF